MKPTDHTFAVCAYGESPYLEECIESLMKQTVPTNILIATSTDNAYIRHIAEKYHIPVFVNQGDHGITQDWNFALSMCKTRYATVAHQDDTYGCRYVEQLLKQMKSAAKPLIFFTDYGELRNGKVVTSNKLLRIKRIMLIPMLFKPAWSSRWIRRRILSFGSAICCPSVTFCLDNVPKEPFQHHFRADEDWECWERLSKLSGQFVYCSEILMCHRIHEESETTKILNDNKRTEEDRIMFEKFWPKSIAGKLASIYSSSEKSNQM